MGISLSCPAQVEAARDALARAATVLVLGGGAVGVEVAAELVEAKGGASVTLATAADELVPDLPPATRNQALAWLRDRGATVLLATRAARVGPAPPGPFAGGDVDVGGERKAYGAVVTCFGAAPSTAWLDGFAALDGRGFVSIDAATHRAVLVDADAKVFAVGDAAAKPDAQRLASYAHLEGEYVAAAAARLPLARGLRRRLRLRRGGRAPARARGAAPEERHREVVHPPPPHALRRPQVAPGRRRRARVVQGRPVTTTAGA